MDLSEIQAQSATFLSGLGRFFELLDGNDPPAANVSAAPAAIVLNVEHFQLDRELTLPCAFMPVAGWTWSQGLWSVIELASWRGRLGVGSSVGCAARQADSSMEGVDLAGPVCGFGSQDPFIAFALLGI